MLGLFAPLPQPQSPTVAFRKVSIKKQTRESLGLTTGAIVPHGEVIKQMLPVLSYTVNHTYLFSRLSPFPEPRHPL